MPGVMYDVCGTGLIVLLSWGLFIMCGTGSDQ